MRTFVSVDKVPAVIEIAVANGAADCNVILEISIVLLINRKSFVGVFGTTITPLAESPTIEIPSAVIVRGPPLLFST